MNKKYYIIEAYKFDKFMGFANGNWDYNDEGNKEPVLYDDYRLDEVTKYATYDDARKPFIDLSTEFIIYDFKIMEVTEICANL